MRIAFVLFATVACIGLLLRQASSLPARLFVTNTTVHVEQITVATKGSLPAHSYAVALFTVQFNDTISVHRVSDPSKAHEEDKRAWQFLNADAPFGLFRLTCKNMVFESYPAISPRMQKKNKNKTPESESSPSSSSAQREDYGPPIYLFPLSTPPVPSDLEEFGQRSATDKDSDKDTAHTMSEEAGHIAYELLSLQHSAAQGPLSASSLPSSPSFSSSFLQLALVLQYRQPIADLSGRPTFVRVLDESVLDSCVLSALKSADQILSPPAFLLHHSMKTEFKESIRSGTFPAFALSSSLEGPLPFTRVSSSPLQFPLRSSLSSSSPSSSTSSSSSSSPSSFAFASAAVSRSLHRASTFLSQLHVHQSESDYDEAACVFNPDRDVIFLDESSDASVSITAMAANPVTGAIKGVGDMLTGMACGVFGGQMDTMMRGAVAPALNVAIVENLERSIPPQIQIRSVMNIGKRMKETLPPPTAAHISNIVAYMLTQRVTDFNIDHTTPLVSNIVANKIDGITAQHVIRMVNDNLARLLTRSVTQSVVPSLSLTLEQSPLRVSWCTACREYGQLCQYCWQNAKNLYYGFYYAAYYSLYYSDFYGKWFNDIAVQFTREERERESKFDLMKNRFKDVQELEDPRNHRLIPDGEEASKQEEGGGE